MQTRTDSARVAGMVQRHGDALLRVARRHSLCADDAQDALQRGLEIYLRRLDRVDPATELAWLKVVVKHEAMAVRRTRSASVSGEEVDFDLREAEVRPIPERYEAQERSGRSAEALRKLKADEATALMLKAEGLSYEEIGQRFGWTYTKVNRCITEGRRRFLRVYEDLETGDACESYAPALAALAQGGATSQQVVALRPHLRHCGACRATMRELHAERRPRAAALLPIPALLAPLRWVQALLQRAAASDVATTVQIASSGGGARGTGVAALVGLCLTGAGPTCLSDSPPSSPAPAKAARAEAPARAKRPAARAQVAAASRPAPVARTAAGAADPPAPTRRIRQAVLAAPAPATSAPRASRARTEFAARPAAQPSGARAASAEFAHRPASAAARPTRSAPREFTATPASAVPAAPAAPVAGEFAAGAASPAPAGEFAP